MFFDGYRWCMLATVPKPKQSPKQSPKPPAPQGHTQTAFRLPNELLEQLDAIVEAANLAQPWPKMTRSDLVRLVLTKVIEERPDWLPGGTDGSK